MSDFRSVLGVPQQDLRENEKNDGVGKLKTRKGENFAPKIDLTKKVVIHRRKRTEDEVLRKRAKIDNSVVQDIFEESDEEIPDQGNHLNESFNDTGAPSDVSSSIKIRKIEIMKEKLATENLQIFKTIEKSSSEMPAQVNNRRALLKQALLNKELDTVSAKQDPVIGIENAADEAKLITPIVLQEELKIGEISESSENESGSSDSDSDLGSIVQLKFVPKSKRIVTNEASEEVDINKDYLDQGKREKEAKRQIVLEKRHESRVALEKAKRSDLGVLYARSDMLDDSDGVDEAAEYQQWRVREMRRLITSLEREHQYDFDLAERNRRAKLSPSELEAENRTGERVEEREKAQIGFLQRYYHKGAFFMDQESFIQFEEETGRVDPRRKDYLEPTGDDRRNAELLPTILQKKKFGKKSQTKWTHLSNEDTTKGENIWKEAYRFGSNRKTES